MQPAWRLHVASSLLQKFFWVCHFKDFENFVKIAKLNNIRVSHTCLEIDLWCKSDNSVIGYVHNKVAYKYNCSTSEGHIHVKYDMLREGCVKVIMLYRR